MPQPMIIPTEWLVEAGVQYFKPKWIAYCCDDMHQCIALNEIEVPCASIDGIGQNLVDGVITGYNPTYLGMRAHLQRKLVALVS
jgi:hypothetical protein